MPVKKMQRVDKLFPWPLDCLPVSLAIQENAQVAVVEVSGRGMAIHGIYTNRKL